MDNVFNFIIHTRKAFIELMEDLSVEELNQLPLGFNNNIIWNFGHIVVSMQTLCYVRTGIWPDKSPVEFVTGYEKGSKPAYFVEAPEIAALKNLSITTVQQIKDDYNTGLFADISTFSTSTYRHSLTCIEEVLITSAGHDNFHFGYARAQKAALKKQ